MSPFKLTGLICAVLSTAFAGFLTVKSAVGAPVRTVQPVQGIAIATPTSQAWPLTPTEAMARNGLDAEWGRFGLVQGPVKTRTGEVVIAWQVQGGEIAAVTTDQNAQAAIGNMILKARGIGASEVMLNHEAEKRCGVAVVQSAGFWVARPGG
jgi:hypothetical protein